MPAGARFREESSNRIIAMAVNGDLVFIAAASFRLNSKPPGAG